MSKSEEFYNLLFEVSNKDRDRILYTLHKEEKRVSDLSRELDLTYSEIRRHISRLQNIDLIQKDLEGYYHLSPYGEVSLSLFYEFDFLSRNRGYFVSHTPMKNPPRFFKQIGDLKESKKIESVMEFLRYSESLFKESNEYVWLLVDQFPLNSLSTIKESIERGVKFRIIELGDRAFSPDLDSMTSEETQAFIQARNTPLVEQRILDEVGVFLYLSKGRCVIAFPTSDDQFDYKGFTASDESSLYWCRELFQHYWDVGEQRSNTSSDVVVKRERVAEMDVRKQIIIEGRNDPNIDTQVLQDAVDNFDEVILRGRFNLDSARMRTSQLGTTSIKIRRSVILRGEGREDDVPSTKIVKSNWKFPLLEYENLLLVEGDGIDVTIENIHFQDFNSICIGASQGNSVKICNNRITLFSGLGRGTTYGDMGDQVIGITVASSIYPEGSFPGGIVIEGNYLDFALSYTLGGFVPRKKVLDPNYRPDHKNHESYLGFGILVNVILGKAIIKDNIIRNMNARGIIVQDNFESAKIQITGNTIVSEIFGSYPFSTHFSGSGIQVNSAWSTPVSGQRVEISSNEIRCEKLNYCGIAVYGPSMYQVGAGKLGECIVHNNDIHLGDGSVGILIRKNDETEVYSNVISGKAYYGFHISGDRDREGFDLGSNRNLITDNDMTDLMIKPSDEYSDSHVDGRMFTGSEGKSKTAHVWLNRYTRDNVVKVQENEIVIDEGENNKISI